MIKCTATEYTIDNQVRPTLGSESEASGTAWASSSTRMALAMRANGWMTSSMVSAGS
eukprot:CAMPEP_0201283428 /NCGR_PEP_ID=MMETSP1317-20130820/8542_1 /ASSEMBLY_ACC=CAM_ASM_000770 /TAXON_ID=187299 /ORGANISM="Undescribed Undescribed, Strain Undescribed" /LENGTH=56 /DNA_ID=CAMNT_0047599653 /DNA_START=147 /DNA_END=317 /DNA_ORIENTATION=-